MTYTASRPNTVSRVIVALACLLALAARAGETPRHEPISPILLQHGQDPRRVELGARLYFSDGSAAATLDAVRAMARYQPRRRIPDEDTAAITVFLGTLVGEHPRLGT